MSESSLADKDLVALPDAANEAVFATHAEGARLTDPGASAMLQGIEPFGRECLAVVRFRESGAALFRPFRVY